jgi:class 3 adenylate cyclase
MGGRHFRFYISSALVFLALFVSLTVGTVLLWTLKAELEDEIADRLVNTARLGVKTLDLEAFERLTKLLSPSLTDAERDQIEASPDYRSISDSLNELRAMKPDLFLYVYTLFPTSDPKVAKFVVDADVLALRRELSQTGKTSSAITPFNMEYKLDDQPLTVHALQARVPVAEPSFVYDYSEDVYSMMGLAPIFSKNGDFLGVLGIDASNQKVSAYLYRLFLVAVVLTLVLVAIILVAALRMAHVLSRPILDLTESVRRISGKDWKVRVDVRSKIKEIYDLKATFNDMADRIESYQDSLILTNDSLLRFVPIEFLKFLDRKDITEVKLGDQTQKDMAVLFLDIRGFSSLSDAMSPKHIFNFLNTYLSRIAPIIREHGGFIDKYQGDAIMALFPGDCDDAVNAALGIQKELLKFNADRERERLPAIEIGIGIHAGVMMLGTIGEERRIQGTVIADAVNVAGLLEELTTEYGVGMLVSKDFFNRLKRPEALKCRFIGWARLRGKVEPFSLLEVFEADSEDQKTKKMRSKPEFERGVSLLQEGQALAARAVFEAILRDNPLDKTALRLVEDCRKQG